MVAVVAQRWDVAQPQDAGHQTRGMVQALAIVIRPQVLAAAAGIAIAGNVIRGT